MVPSRSWCVRLGLGLRDNALMHLLGGQGHLTARGTIGANRPEAR